MKRVASAENRPNLREKNGFYDDPQLAEFFGITLLTLKNRRSRGDLPPSSKIGRDRLTSVEDLVAFVRRRREQAAA